MPRRVYANLRAYFEDHRLRQTGLRAMDVADDLHISHAYLSMIKWGQREPDLALALRIAAKCSVPLESLIRSNRKAS
jgi:transcriptional regulator with XRE-family HTH domain